MSRNNKFNAKPSWRDQYDEGIVHNRTNFKRYNQRKKSGHIKNFDTTIRAHLEEQAMDVGNTSSSARIGRGKRGGLSRGGVHAGLFLQRNFLEQLGWYRILLPFGNKYEKGYVLKLLSDAAQPHDFYPIRWQTNGNRVEFYIDDDKVADLLAKLDRSFTMPDEYKFLIKVGPGFPHVEITPDLREKIKLAMAARYNSTTKALDLSRFHLAPELQDVFCGLFKPIVLDAVYEIIAENIPEIEAINLDNNKISSLVFPRKLANKLSNIKILHLANNKIRHFRPLETLLGLPLIELVLTGNPIANSYKDHTSYVSAVRERFPKLRKLDFNELPPIISFDINDDASLPNAVETFLCNAEGEPWIRQFVQQYFSVFDSENRQALLEAYHSDSMLSMTMGYPFGERDKNSWLNWYNNDNRNLMRLTDHNRRYALLKKGRSEVLTFLTEMPRSQHNMLSFTVDLLVYTPQIITLALTGLFKELQGGHKIPPLRAFFRTWIIMPSTNGMCIVNETMYITNATERQKKIAKTVLDPSLTAPAVVTPSISGVGATIPVNPSAVIQSGQATPQVLDDSSVKRQMVQALSDQSGMNLSWSERCLVDINWDYDRALMAFAELNKQGVIPAEAFAKQ